MHYAKVSGSQFEVTPLSPGKVQYFQGSGEIDHITKHNGHGEEDRYVYTIKPKFMQFSEGDTEVSEKVDKSVSHFSKSMSASQKLKWWIDKGWENHGCIGSMEANYQKRMVEITANEEDLAKERE